MLVFRSLAFRVAFPRDLVEFDVLVLVCGVQGTFGRSPLKAFRPNKVCHLEKRVRDILSLWVGLRGS